MKQHEDGGISYSRREYWSPDMTAEEKASVRGKAKYELFKTNNYIDEDTKWLYDTSKGRKHFAIYSTENTEEPTILYASKGELAEFEYSWLIQAIEEGGYGSFDELSKAIDSIFENDRNVDSSSDVHSWDTLGTRRNNRDASLYIGHKRNQPSQALLNCLRNIEEVYERNGELRDRQYLEAVENGDNETLERMIKNAAHRAGFTSPRLYYTAVGETFGLPRAIRESPLQHANDVEANL